MNFKNRIIIITGASSGIGAHAAEVISKLGGSVVITGRNQDNLKRTVEKCEGETFPIIADVNNEEDRSKIIKQTLEKYGKIDVLVNNAGIGSRGTILDTKMETFDSMMNTNVRSVFHLTQLAAPHLIESKGNVVNVASFVGMRPIPGNLSYGMSKAALDYFTKCVALELAPMGVRVNSVNPGIILTEFQKRIGMNEESYDSFLQQIQNKTPIGRVGTVAEISQAIAFLACNEASSFITGVTLSVDGGLKIIAP
ncbi:CLUMA_CG013492, isoform A [Clunio marinus]|uniref:CLUMA_CG013492, isoform A n=1 Tax=Clunio marinus TaxID=568069 RepID=A0A1J1IKD1_9DIPT|nr:CLUMA_CG013492, isoform A [Clunio marinus]